MTSIAQIRAFPWGCYLGENFITKLDFSCLLQGLLKQNQDNEEFCYYYNVLMKFSLRKIFLKTIAGTLSEKQLVCARRIMGDRYEILPKKDRLEKSYKAVFKNTAKSIHGYEDLEQIFADIQKWKEAGDFDADLEKREDRCSVAEVFAAVKELQNPQERKLKKQEFMGQIQQACKTKKIALLQTMYSFLNVASQCVDVQAKIEVCLLREGSVRVSGVKGGLDKLNEIHQVFAQVDDVEECNAWIEALRTHMRFVVFLLWQNPKQTCEKQSVIQNLSLPEPECHKSP